MRGDDVKGSVGDTTRCVESGAAAACARGETEKCARGEKEEAGWREGSKLLSPGDHSDGAVMFERGVELARSRRGGGESGGASKSGRCLCSSSRGHKRATLYITTGSAPANCVQPSHTSAASLASVASASDYMMIMIV